MVGPPTYPAPMQAMWVIFEGKDIGNDFLFATKIIEKLKVNN
jgi:hypothetical protein